MKDEKFVYYQDINQKKVIARSSHNKRSHTGKGGSIRFPSDSLTKKELKEMNSATKTYKMNEPISWADFKAMPTDLQRQYLKNLRDTYNVEFSTIATMFGCSTWTMNDVAKKLGLGANGKKIKLADQNLKGWEAFCNGNNAASTVPAEEIITTKPESTPEQPKKKPLSVDEIKAAIPLHGSMSFSGNATQALETMIAILGGAAVDITISWQQPLVIPMRECKGAVDNG